MDSLIGTLIVLCPVLLVILIFGFGMAIGWYFLGGKDAIASNDLRKKIYSLNPIQGKTREEIERVVGPPNSWVSGKENKTVCSWDRTKYHISLMFNGNICEGVVSEINI